MSLPLSKVRQVVSMDIDGCLADFVTPYAELCSAACGHPVSANATSWNWVRGEGVTQDHEDAVWRQIHADPEFWMRLKPLPGAKALIEQLNARANNHLIYFMTNRPLSAKFWTEMWLGELGMEVPTVIITKQKGKASSALGVTLALDDMPDNVMDMYRSLPNTASLYLMAKPWNTWAAEEWSAEIGPKVVHTLSEWVERSGL